jgi:hypothetical protein
VGTPCSPLHFIFRPHKEKGWTEWEWVYWYIKCSVTGHTTLLRWPTSTTLKSSDSGNTRWSKPGNRRPWDNPCALEKETTRWCVCAGLVCSLVEIVCAAALGYAFEYSVSEMKLISFLDLCGFLLWPCYSFLFLDLETRDCTQYNRQSIMVYLLSPHPSLS